MLLLTTALFGSVAERRVLLALVDEVAVDLVGQDDDAPCGGRSRRGAADRSALQQLPVGFCGLQRRKTLVSLVDAALEVLEVDLVAAVDEPHRALFGGDAGVREIAVEAVVDRRRHQHLAAAGTEGLERRDQRRMHAGRQDQVGGIDRDVVAPLVPVDDALLVGRGGRAVHVHVAPARRAACGRGAPW